VKEAEYEKVRDLSLARAAMEVLGLMSPGLYKRETEWRGVMKTIQGWIDQDFQFVEEREDNLEQ
jgi:hypothetical protein